MGFLSPYNLLWFLPLGAAIVVLYLLKLRRKEKIVSTVMLWAQAVQDVQANAPFQKLKKNILLFIQLSALLLAVFALMRPYARATGLTGQNIVVIMDSSASMKAADVAGGRFEQARAIARRTINNLGRGDTMMLISAASKTRVVSPFTADKKALDLAVGRLRCSDTRANLREAMVLASSLVAKKKHPQIVIISDGAFKPVRDVRIPGAAINFVRVGRRAGNVGIVAMDARRTLAGVQQVLVGLKNCASDRRKFNLEFYIGGSLGDIREESLAAGEQKIEMLNIPADSPGGWVKAMIDIRDDLATDNQAQVFLDRPKRISALLVTKGNVFLESALNLDPRTDVVKTSTPPARLNGYDIIIFDRVKPPADLPRGSYLLIDAFTPIGPALSAGRVNAPVIVDWDKTHPTMRFVNFSEVGIQYATRLKPMSWGKVVLEAQQGPIAVAGEFDGRKFLVLGFDLEKSNFPMVPGFPIMMANCLDWFSGRTGGDVNLSARTGEPVPIEVPATTRSFTVTAPDGSKRVVPVNSNPVYYDGTEQAGLYTIRGKGVNRQLAVNLLWPEDSDTKPQDQVFVGEKDLRASTGGVKTNKEFWRYALLALLGMLCAEWYIYHRRI